MIVTKEYVRQLVNEEMQIVIMERTMLSEVQRLAIINHDIEIISEAALGNIAKFAAQQLPHIALDIAGLVPGWGEGADISNAALYAKKGEYFMSLLSLVSMIPALGDALGKGGKIGVFMQKAGSTGAGKAMASLARLLAKHAKKIKTFIERLKQNKLLAPFIDQILGALDSFIAGAATATVDTAAKYVQKAINTVPVKKAPEGTIEKVKAAAPAPQQPAMAAEGMISEGFVHHITTMTPTTESVYRVGSDKYFELIREVRAAYNNGDYKPLNEEEEEMLQTNLGEWDEFDGEQVPLDFPMYEESLEEAKKKKKKDPPIGKPMKNAGGGKKYKVYVRNPKTGNIKKITYGDAKGGLKGNWNNAEARQSFATRHNCADKKDRTKAGYWACRAHKDFGTNVPGRFW